MVAIDGNGKRAVETGHILIVDDDPIAGAYLERVIAANGFDRCDRIEDPRRLEDLLDGMPVSVVLLDLNMPHLSGQDLLKMIAAGHPDVSVIVITAEDSIETAVECMRLGAFDFMTKPVEPNRLAVAVRNALSFHELRREMSALSAGMLARELEHPEAFSRIITGDERMRNLFRYIEAIAGSGQSVLITGESGTGKELLARAVHDVSAPGQRFVAVNVAGLDDTMFSDTLFGHVSGAYTSADGERDGLASRAAGGTLFLDEIADLTQQSQTKLLRLIQEREFYPLGADDPKRFRARVVAATNGDIESLVEQGKFRKDLYYRLLTHRIQIPPLRERASDIRLLVDAFLTEASGSSGDVGISLPEPAYSALERHRYPGNVRELQSIVFDLVSRLASGESSDSVTRELELRFGSGDRSAKVPVKELIRCFGRFPTIEEVERILIDAALAECNGNQTAAARLVGVSQSTMSRKLRR